MHYQRTDHSNIKCDPLFEIQNLIMREKKHKSLISTINFTIIWNIYMILVNIKDIKVQFSQNVLYHVKDDFLYKKKQITKKRH